MKKNYKLHKKVAGAGGGKKEAFCGHILNCQLSIVNEIGTHGLLQDLNYKQTTKGSRGLHQGSFQLQTMTALIKSFCGGVQGVKNYKLKIINC